MTFYISIALCAFLLTLLGTRIAILAMRTRRENMGYANLPTTAHKFLPQSIQGGGVVLVFSAAICMAVADLRFDILLPLFMLTSLALIEKLIPLPWFLQMLVQIFAISIPLGNFVTPTFGGLLPVWMDILLVGAMWMWFINMLKGMDDVDGFAASAIASIGAGICIITVVAGDFPSLLASYSLIAATAACGFLWWNWPPAKISLGRVGSVPLGFLLGYLILLSIREGYGFAMLCMSAYYLSDSVMSWTKRTWASKPLSLTHDEHGYQLAIRNGRSQKFVVRSITGLNILLVFLAVQTIIEPELALFHTLVAYLTVFMLLGFFKKKRAH